MNETTEPEEAAARLEAGRLLFAKPWTFARGVANARGLPASDGIEVAFAGRSNVGKSSLINALTGRKALARTSNTPGRTRELNFFTAGAGLTIVDMPGYGYARASKREIAGWTRLLFDYLRGRANLRRVYLLVDSRHGLKASDSEALDVFDQAAVSYQIVLTKCDQLKPDALTKVLDDTATAIAKRPAAYPEILSTSVTTGTGIPELRAAIAALL
ncbi:ribosome biogenesis GTP-binding protein YihA/YsxC [Bauldia sp.]|uniref:ribosome biogenesis GTP-binding protein YihA/YsxC n=1 Tax=Bauldia sp. TaxID=2575872 RepID=UPI003BA84877